MICEKCKVSELNENQLLGLPPQYPKLTRNKFLWVFPSKKPYLLAKIILTNKQVVTYWKDIDQETQTIKCGGMAYVVRPEAIYTEKKRLRWFPVSYYYWDNPSPIVWDKDKNSTIINSGTFRDALDTKVIQDVLNPKISGLLIIVLLVSVVSACASVYLALKDAGIIGGGA